MSTPTPNSPAETPFPLSAAAQAMDDHELLGFLERQMAEYGGNLAIEPDLWVLFAIPSDDQERNILATELLRNANFTYDSGPTEGDAWTLFYVNTENRAKAVFWLDDLNRIISGHIREATPAQRALFDDLISSPAAHRVARNLVELHAKGEIVAGAVRDPQIVRGLLDRLHAQEPLFLSAFLILLEHHLIDILVLYQKLIDEDIHLGNELLKGSISQDPIFQNRQTTAANMRKELLRLKIINPLDQQKHASVTNPYVPFTETRLDGDDMIIHVDGIDRKIRRSDFVTALRLLRKEMYRGTTIEHLNTQTPWVTEATAQPLRFLKQQLDARKDVAPLDWLYMLERAVDPERQI